MQPRRLLDYLVVDPVETILLFLQRSSPLRRLCNAAARHGWVTFPLFFAAFMTVLCPWWSVYEFDVDEGFNMAKAVLVANGFRLYADVWSDQPPLLTYLLAARELVDPWSIAQARGIVLVFSCILLGSLYRIVTRLEGTGAAWLAVLSLAGADIYERLSVSVMIGLPAVALAALALERCIGTRGRAGLVLSGAIFGLAVQTKLFVLPLVIAFPCIITANGLRGVLPVRERLLSLVLWVAGFGGCLGAALMLYDPTLEQLVSPHLAAASRAKEAFASMDYLVEKLQDWTVLVPASLLGLIAAIRRPGAGRTIPVLLGLTTFLILANHRPLNNHQILLVAFPLSWLSGVGIMYLTGVLREAASRRYVFVALGGLFIFLLVSLVPDAKKLSSMRTKDDTGRFALQELRVHGRSTDFMFSDHPIDVYYMESKIPPAIAVPSMKRVHTGHLDPSDFMREVETWKPSQLLFRRKNINYPPEIHEYLKGRYVLVPNGGWSHYLREKPEFDTASLLDLTLRAAEEYAAMNVHGGYTGFMDPCTGKLYERQSLHEKPLPAGTITIRPPGSTASVGSCFLELAALTGRQSCLQTAIDAARALACAQSSQGGWGATQQLLAACDPGAQPANVDVKNTLDEGTQQAVLDFLLDLRTTLAGRGEDAPGWLEETIADGSRFLLDIQKEAGGWARQIPHANDYSAYSTLNDRVVSSSISILLRGYREFGDARYLEAARKGGQFLIRTQGQAPQAGWAQQYDDELRPAAARMFEPRALSSRESAYAMITLAELFLETRDPAFAGPLPAAARWLENSTIRQGVWSRFYEIGSNRPIYGDRDGSVHYSLDEISKERRKGYDWEKTFPEVVHALDLAGALESAGYDGLRRAWDEAGERERKDARGAAWATVARLVHGGTPAFRMEGELISARKFVASCTAVIDYLDSVQGGKHADTTR